MAKYNSKDIALYDQDMISANKSVRQKATELGIPRATLSSALYRYRANVKLAEATNGGKPVVKVYEKAMRNAAPETSSLADLLRGIETNVAMIKSILGMN